MGSGFLFFEMSLVSRAPKAAAKRIVAKPFSPFPFEQHRVRSAPVQGTTAWVRASIDWEE
jgi:hypothetical protein